MSRERARPRRAGTLALALALAAMPALAARDLPAPLRPFEASYAVTRNGIQVGTTELTLASHARGWRLHSVTQAQGLLALMVSKPSTEETILTRHDGGLRPLHYRHTEPDEADHLTVAFDWQAGTARVERGRGGDNETLALEPGTHDPFSALLVMMQRIADGAESVRLPGIDDEGERNPLAFAVAARETVAVPLGRYDSVRVRRVRADKRSTVLWLAPELDWLPVRMEQRRKGELVARAELNALDGERSERTRSGRRNRRGR